MRNRWWAIFIMAWFNAILYFGSWAALGLTLWVLSFIAVGVKDWLTNRRAKGEPKLLSNIWVKMGLFMILIMVLIFLVIIPLVMVTLRFIGL